MSAFNLTTEVMRRLESAMPRVRDGLSFFPEKIHSLVVEDATLALGGKPVEQLPDRVVQETFRAVNCTAQPQSESIHVTLKTVTGQMISLTRTVTTNMKISASLKIGPLGIGAEGSRTVDFTTATQQTHTEEKAVVRKVERTVPAFKELYVRSTIIERTVKWPVSGEFIVDGTVQLGVNNTSDRPTTLLLRGPIPISELLPARDRKFRMEGMLDNVTASDMIVYYAERDVAPGDCAEGFELDDALEVSGVADTELYALARDFLGDETLPDDEAEAALLSKLRGSGLWSQVESVPETAVPTDLEWVRQE